LVEQRIHIENSIHHVSSVTSYNTHDSSFARVVSSPSFSPSSLPSSLGSDEEVLNT
jgi:hypothetical protein